MVFWVSAALFLVFVSNVSLGAFWGRPFMGDVWEMLVLFLTSVTFVVGILLREARRNSQGKTRS